MKKTVTLFLSLLLFAAVAFAHGGVEHVMGTVTKVTEKSITVETKDKKTVEINLTADTKFLKGETAVALKDLKVGDRVVVDAKKDGSKLVATRVRMAAAEAAHKH